MDYIGKKCSKKKAFTLTEAVVTLVVIGVIALLLFPSLIQNYQKQELYNRFIHAYTELENLLPTLTQKMGPVWKWDGNDCANIVDYMNVLRECTNDGDCFAERYKRNISLNTTSTVASSLYKGSNSATPTRTVELVDGSVVKVARKNKDILDRAGACVINIDTNGKKGPNTYGRDLFRLAYLDFGQLAPYLSQHNYWDKYGFVPIGDTNYFNVTHIYESREAKISSYGDPNARANQVMERNGLRYYCVNQTPAEHACCVYYLLREGKMDY